MSDNTSIWGPASVTREIDEAIRRALIDSSTRVHGCICPAGAEKTCEGPLCPRRAWSGSAA